jgi:uncharacterized membrane protein (DUF4010 family)
MQFSVATIHPLEQLLVSLALGLLVGLQRQWAESPLGGFRTFSLIALLGTVCALFADQYGGGAVALGFIGTISAMVIGRLKGPIRTSSPEHSGLVTEFAMLLMFTSGVLVHFQPIWLAVSLAGALAVILQAKMDLHGLAQKFTEKEIRAIMQFVLISMVILPIVPNQNFGPMDVLNPHQIWMMVVLIVGIGLAGYISYKFFGEKAGVLLGGILGGVISSTATTLTYSRRSKGSESAVQGHAIVILIAWAILYPRVILEILLVAPKFHEVIGPVAILFAVSILSSVWLWKSFGQKQHGMPQQNNPTEIKTAVVFALLYAGVLLATTLSKEYFGAQGLMLVAIFSGITDVDAMTLSTARLVETGKLGSGEAWPLILAAIVSNIFFKGILAFFVGGKRLFKTLFFSWMITMLVGIGLILFH